MALKVWHTRRRATCILAVGWNMLKIWMIWCFKLMDAIPVKLAWKYSMSCFHILILFQLKQTSTVHFKVSLMDKWMLKSLKREKRIADQKNYRRILRQKSLTLQEKQWNKMISMTSKNCNILKRTWKGCNKTTLHLTNLFKWKTTWSSNSKPANSLENTTKWARTNTMNKRK